MFFFCALDRVLVMLTDSLPSAQTEPVEEIYDLIRERNAQLNNSIAIYTYGLVSQCESQCQL